ncbi:cupin domain-containing protein [Lacrimispora sp. 38-1]|uniref:cupin domain-containing protein n=1 Tax=Lacrimispora sp. 38-1 TaxID=3125778 RepID=UPI003CF18D64
MIKIMEPDFKFKNDTGLLVQLVHNGWKQINVLYSDINSVRGGHYHKICCEAFYVVKGKFELTLEMNGNIENYIFAEGEMFMISPYQKHTFSFLEDTIMVSMYDIGVELPDGTKDIYNN